MEKNTINVTSIRIVEEIEYAVVMDVVVADACVSVELRIILRLKILIFDFFLNKNSKYLLIIEIEDEILMDESK